jgi:hypothetical protein
MHMRDGSSSFTRNVAARLHQWNFMAISFNRAAGTLLFKVNDKTQSFYVGTRWPKTSANTIFFGYRPNSQNGIFKGKMSCVMLFGSALNKGQLENIRKYCNKFLNHLGKFISLLALKLTIQKNWKQTSSVT